MRLHTIKPNPGAKHRRKRLGIGESSGKGKTSGKGHKGQKARSGGSIRLGFEGGQMPIYRQLPKRGFNNAAFKTTYGVVNLDSLQKNFEAGAIVTEAALRGSSHYDLPEPLRWMTANIGILKLARVPVGAVAR